MYFQVENKQSIYEARRDTQLSPAPHIHKHMEIVLSYSGESLCTADTKQGLLEAGDLFIAFPNQIHYYLDKIRPVKHSILILSPDICPEFGRIFKTKLPESPIIKNAAANERIVSSVETILECRKHGGEYSDAELRGSMLILMCELFKTMKLEENASYDTDIAKDIINFCYENYDSDISLQSVADALHISRCYVSRLFSRRLNVGFSEYINTLRIGRACELLKAGDNTVTEVAGLVGYNSVRTFDRVFLDRKGVTPRKYRAAVFQPEV